MSNTPDLKGSSFTLSVLHLSDTNVDQAVDLLKDKVSQAPAFFANAPVVINVEQVEADIDFKALKSGITTAGMIPVGVTGSKGTARQEQIREAGLAIMSGSKPVAPSKPEPVAPEPRKPTKVIRTPIRSGQQIYAQDSDLVILNHVSAGAEVIADGSIHIYGTLRGRAIAGANGLKEAQIYCNDLQAELISISGNYWLSDQINSEYWQQKVVLTMVDDVLKLDILTI